MIKSDIIIIGSELDAFVACIRLNELGFDVRILSNGKGSLLYSLGNIKVLSLNGQLKNQLSLREIRSGKVL